MALTQVDPSGIKMESSWLENLRPEFAKPYFSQIKCFLSAEKSSGKVIFPPGQLIFNAFNSTPFEKVRVVILGQDPYHGQRQAMGLSFSVPRGISIPASLKNIYKEMHRDIDFKIPNHGDLSPWASQGVFLLNTILTVEQNNAGSHSKIGWHLFTDAVIKTLSDHREGIIFLLWGNYARLKKVLISQQKHTILETAHPSPLARDAFNGCSHFSKTNTILAQRGEVPIDWTL